MRLLVLGGTVFLSRATAEEAVRRGHEVVCACRGESGSVPDGVRHVAWDRSGPVPAELAAEEFDAVVDVARHPSWVRAAVAAWPSAHWAFVSTINVYADDATPRGGPENLPLHEPVTEDRDLREDPEAYGPMKVACEQAVLDGAPSAIVVRPGLIVGPGDPTGRFTYWPARLADTATHPEVLVPGDANDQVQVIDVRDLATWLVGACERRTTGTFDGTARPMSRAAFTDAVAAAARDLELLDPTAVTFTAVPQDFLLEHDVEPWMGPRSVPVWLPLPEYLGLMAHDVTASYDAGLVTRPLSETAADTIRWLQETPDAVVSGWSREDEAAVLAAWRERG
ncbi:NAD-dependent epimerase/dehydratase family protein [Nocardioides sp. KIGAM211]|uniref:NAD-dependent epimerase/dehydratase family protein n=1 Tax=Nocardioides luti TaxID=2761101 RepID=A0A7X0VB08_9ACTN|nr:NAD-dependent epimerase/dehydratase family protein [Nocardioides luti]MBB6628151.1 NAD-dependent epimerase/dehydratase family protein [Nocardioides luti]